MDPGALIFLRRVVAATHLAHAANVTIVVVLVDDIRLHTFMLLRKASRQPSRPRHVTPDFPKKTKCISYVHQDQVYTHMIDIMSEISVNSNKNVQELNHYIISLLHSNVRLEGL
jgi:hypothetical protein